MEIIKTEKRLQDVTVECYTLCDKCGERITEELYDAFSFDMVAKTGTAYPEGGDGQKWKLDICKECLPKFIKLLEENGYKIQKSEWDY